METRHPQEPGIIKPDLEENLPDYISMYEVQGQDEITGFSFKRYLKDKEGWDEKIKQQVEPSRKRVKAAWDKYSKVVEAEFVQEQKKKGDYEDKILAAPENTRPEIIQDGLNNQDPIIQKISAVGIRHAPEKDRVDLIKIGLAQTNLEIKKTCLEQIQFTPKDDWPRLMEELNTLFNVELSREVSVENMPIQKIYAELVSFIPKKYKAELRKMVFDLVQAALNTNNPAIQRAYAPLIEFSPLEGRDELIEAGLTAEDIEVKKTYARASWFVLPENRGRLYELAKRELGDVLIEPSLYRNTKISKDKFSREPFVKGGSKTTLLGGKLKDKTILRHIEPEAFIAWQQLYENHEVWKAEGFDYVPIEPIVSYSLNTEGLVDVYSGVLDLNTETWHSIAHQFIGELYDDIDKIKSVLNRQHIDHGHDHLRNFCLRFFRDKNGNVDFNKKPHVYLIDFDQAKTA